ncbi:hypothetical protein SETIT_1G233500v2 [Setaria italica]|uniref:Uncharacterized protein n=1 Tax=Setaria italica TaxID=4555 RepID=A0A368PPE4_SETIT|nr:hypothetical protein SETIT_1G233500v2 [Setaria italica]
MAWIQWLPGAIRGSAGSRQSGHGFGSIRGNPCRGVRVAWYGAAAEQSSQRRWQRLKKADSGPLETSLHLCLTCPYAQVVCTQISTWENFNILQYAHPVQFDNIGKWWEKAARSVPKDKKRHFNGLIIYTMWNIWKERNRRIFDQKFLTAQQVATHIKENLEEYRKAFWVIT